MSGVSPTWRPHWERAQQAWRASPLPGFFAWWGSELRALLPRRLRDGLRNGDRWFLLQSDGSHWTLRGAGNPEPRARWNERDGDGLVFSAVAPALRGVDPEDLRLALVMPAAEVLKRTLNLPLAARENLRQVAAYEMDRQTPFPLSQVYYAVRELPTPAAAGRLAAELVVIRRSDLDPLLTRLQSANIQIDAVDVAFGDDRLGLNLLPPDEVPRRVRPRRRLNLALTAGCVLLLVLVLLQWLHNREAALAKMQQQVATLRADAQQVVTLRQQLQDNVAAAGFLTRRKGNSVPVLDLLLDVTDRLPDSAWLERFSVNDAGQMGLQGEAQQAVKLLDLLKASPLITDASFQGSIQPDPTTGKDRFYITAQVRQAPAPAQSSATSSAAANEGGEP